MDRTNIPKNDRVNYKMIITKTLWFHHVLDQSQSALNSNTINKMIKHTDIKTNSLTLCIKFIATDVLSLI